MHRLSRSYTVAFSVYIGDNMARYGMPYKGSKDKIAENIISVLPEAEYFVDLFGGGGAVIDCAMQSGKYQKGIYNELEPLVYEGFRKAVNGEFKSEKRWISREDFFKLKDTDPYVTICWSFGNNLKTYLYSPEIERFKKHLHYMFFAETPKEARLHWKGFVREFALVKKEISQLTQIALKLCKECDVKPIYNGDGTLNAGKLQTDVFKAKSSDIRKYFRDALKGSGLSQSDVDKHLGNQMSGHYFGSSQWALPTQEQYIKMQEIIPALDKPWSELNEKLSVIKKLDELERLQSLQSLERLERLESLERLETFNLSYEQVQIPDNAVVYCDIPYKQTSSYLSEFDHDKFYDWCRKQKATVFISEYQMPDDFYTVEEWQRTSLLSSKSRAKVTEKLFCNKPYKREKQLSFFEVGEKYAERKTTNTKRERILRVCV